MENIKFTNKDIADSFIAYSMPGTTEYLYATMSSIACGTLDEQVRDYDFVFCPFDKEKHQQLFFKFSSLASGRKFECSPSTETQTESTSYNEYSAQFNKIKDSIKGGLLHKAVLSKLKFYKTDTSNLYDQFIALKNDHLNAFTYLLHLPSFGTWLGASPELVLSSTKDSYHTKAVAGTKAADSLMDWTEKEIKEHAFVEEHFTRSFERESLEYSISKSFDLKAGAMVHICSELTVEKSPLSTLSKLMDIIHPSPALSGFPISKAVELIGNVEAHDRSYYCGFLGPISKEGNLSFFANIRCLQAYNNGILLHLGGGLTADSVCEKEWEETELKATTLLSVFKNAVDAIPLP